MSSTRIKIVESSILLFNKKGLANVRLQDIAEYNNISPGNLTYHFKTKKDLMDYIIYYMIRKLVEIEATQRESLKQMSLYNILRNNLVFLFNYRFFFRDILEIINLVPNAKSVFKDVNKINEKFSIEYINISIKNGYMKKEAFDGQYKTFAKNNWSIVSSSLTTWEVLDDSKNKYRKIFDEIMGHFYPYLTKKGVDRYNKKKKEISKKIDQDFNNL
ncbi:TetR/AcrR family transcriptional regulator [Flavobacteriaceae bacterium]|nr:TetR/AcrR family transcriptional regulator [Flavobacteriaceae bacterium]MDB0069202.1 TetR/AcrR family transcriptional regulator [Flavobacteriaceae bacterium]MDB4148313.1 TetR/AcrR family transcriptional regulator [Flavobacteriaceae bacterium]MDB4163773.1 TetR/AcrR family transcriptional regulator [Flavobacteriaceae bacterium]MDB9794122.1 TetR/AcrR family transcriptional regulator [Flavobacteriaceae bacterium]